MFPVFYLSVFRISELVRYIQNEDKARGEMCQRYLGYFLLFRILRVFRVENLSTVFDQLFLIL